MSSTYQALVDAVNQVEHDQSLFESQLGTELQGALHAELVQLGMFHSGYLLLSSINRIPIIH